ncbi:NmrA family NAD(P)-binding protein [Nonomuraea sp. LPB2021202275-12-8]|uniref:NmrA family NAD(P)-binding protein n=1 Tax=Nonomuraea sp. LPB2021202275-12-8 TaxID=3120159 RepID=UPI00300D2FC4
MSPSSILVTGGTGKTGRRVAALLDRRGVPARVASRSGPARFDWADETTWEPALAGVGAVYLVDSQGAGAVAEVRAFAGLAVARGVDRLVLLSARTWAEMGDPAGLAVENAVRETGVAWTILRPSWFAQNFSEDPLIAGPVAQGDLRLPAGEGHEPFIDAEDIAEVAVAALTGDGHAGEIYELSGPRALTWGQAVAEIARTTGRAVRFTPISDEQYRADLAAAGLPDDYAEITSALFAHIRHDRGAALSDGVQRALGREPADFASYARRLAHAADV